MRATLFAAVIVVAAGACLEIGARAFLWQPLGDRFAHEWLDPEPLGDWRPNQDGIWAELGWLPYHVHINAQGFRNLDDVKDGVTRVLALGDSFTFGLYVSNYDVWTNVAESVFNASHPRPVQVLNNGLKGATVVDYRDYLADKGARLTPDVILLAFYANDVSDMGKGETEYGFVRAEGMRSARERYGPLFEVRRFLGEHSGAYVLARTIKDSLFRRRAVEELREAGVQPQAAPDMFVASRAPGQAEKRAVEFKKAFDETIANARKIGARVGVIYFPAAGRYADGDAPDDPRRIVREESARLDLPYFDMSDVFRGRSAEHLYLVAADDRQSGYRGDTHLSREGNIVAGRAIAGFLATLIAR